MLANGWTLLLYDAASSQLTKMREASERAKRAHPTTYSKNSAVKLYQALEKLMFAVIPSDPGRPEYRQGNTLGAEYRHWFRAKFMGRFRLFFRYDSASKTIVYAWLNDEETLRKAGGKSDPYEVFRRMLKSGNPPNDWNALVKASKRDYPA